MIHDMNDNTCPTLLMILCVVGVIITLTGCAIQVPVYKAEFGHIRLEATYQPPDNSTILTGYAK
jgi:hypothetical protein